MPALSKKGIIKSLWVDLLCLAFLGQGEPACFHSWFLGHSSRSSFHRMSPKHQELRDLNWSARPSPCCHDNVFLSDLLWVPLGQTWRDSSSSSVLYLANKLWCSDFLIPPTPLITPTDSLPCLNLLCHSKTDARFMQDGRKAVWSIPYVSVAFFPSLERILLHIVILKCPHVHIAFLKFTSCDNQALVGCTPIPVVAVYLNLK